PRLVSSRTSPRYVVAWPLPHEDVMDNPSITIRNEPPAAGSPGSTPRDAAPGSPDVAPSNTSRDPAVGSPTGEPAARAAPPSATPPPPTPSTAAPPRTSPPLTATPPARARGSRHRAPPRAARRGA